MKQHITKEQLQELDRVQLYKLKDILSHGDPIFNIEEKLDGMKLIEILNKEKEIKMYSLGSVWYISDFDSQYLEHELVDALWKAVKEVL